MAVNDYCGFRRRPDGLQLEGEVDGIPYTTDLAGPGGVCVTLFPRRGTHTVSDVARTKPQLRNHRDVDYFQVVWDDPQPEQARAA